MLPDDGRSISQNIASLNILVHDVINLLYYRWSHFVSFAGDCSCFIHFYLAMLNVACYHVNCSKIDYNKLKCGSKPTSTITKTIESHFLKTLRKCNSNVYAIYIKTMARINAVEKFSLYYQTTFKINICAHHIYKNIWTPKLNKSLRGKHNIKLESDLQDTIGWGRKWFVYFSNGKTQLVSFDWSDNSGDEHQSLMSLLLEFTTVMKYW